MSSFLETLPKTERWAGLEGLGMVEAECHIGDEISRERRYYIASFTDDAKKFGHAVRKHWGGGVENFLHWVLDVTFREDDSRIRSGRAPENFNIIRQVALNLLKKDKSKMSVKSKRFKAALSDDFREAVIFS